jgi:hypothetical protein
MGIIIPYTQKYNILIFLGHHTYATVFGNADNGAQQIVQKRRQDTFIGRNLKFSGHFIYNETISLDGGRQ